MPAAEMTAIEIMAKLIAFDSVSSRSNMAIIRWIGDYLAGYGIKAEIVEAPGGEPKANLWASVGPDRDGGIVLSGHTDVVPVEGQPWSRDPFTLKDGGGSLVRPRHLRHERLHRAQPRFGAAMLKQNV